MYLQGAQNNSGQFISAIKVFKTSQLSYREETVPQNANALELHILYQITKS